MCIRIARKGEGVIASVSVCVVDGGAAATHHALARASFLFILIATATIFIIIIIVQVPMPMSMQESLLVEGRGEGGRGARASLRGGQGGRVVLHREVLELLVEAADWQGGFLSVPPRCLCVRACVNVYVCLYVCVCVYACMCVYQ